MNNYLKPERLWLKNKSNLDEKWVQQLIANDSIDSRPWRSGVLTDYDGLPTLYGVSIKL